MKNSIIIVIVIVVLTIVISPWIIAPILNDIKANSIEKEILAIPLPDNTQCIESLSFCGNTSGTGDHVEIWSGILIRTTLTEEEIKNYYKMDCNKVENNKPQILALDIYNKEFESLKYINNFIGCYIIYKVDNAVLSWFDLRGA